MSRRMVPAVLTSAAAVAAALALSCTNDAGPPVPVTGFFSVAPRFESSVAGIVPLARARILLTRVPSETIAKDTVVDLAAGTDSVDLSIAVVLLEPSETFLLSMQLITATGDTAFRAGPVEVTPASGGAPPVIPLDLVYTGTGADAASVVVRSADTTIVAGDTALLVAEALDGSGQPIPGTPIAWTAGDSAIVRVVSRDAGKIVGLVRGTTRVRAELLTGPADSAAVAVMLPPANILADSGSGQTGPAGSPLPSRLVARVTASDGLGVPGQWVRFSVGVGGGSLSPDSLLSTDSVRTDSTGRAAVSLTLGNVAGLQTVVATTSKLPGKNATFSETSTATGAGMVAIVAGDQQTGVVGTALAVAPSVRVTDVQGNPVAGVTVTFAVTGGGGSITSPTPVTDASGIAAVGGWTLGPAVGLHTLTATVTGITPIQFVALATSPGGATAMVANAGNGQTVLAKTNVPVAPAVLVTDTAGAPVAGVTVTFAVATGGGSVSGGAAVSDGSGIATVGSWTLGSPGLNTLTASLAGVPDVVFSATGTVGSPDSVVIISGDAQSGDAGTALANPLVVEVRDSVGNPVANIDVAWATLFGSLSPVSGPTDSAGRAQSTWTLGVNAISQTATATVSGITPALFGGTAVFQNPTVLLALAGTDRIRLTDSAQLNVTLTAPAPTGGVVVNFSVDNPSVIGLDTTDLSIAETGTTTQTRLYGLSSGTTTVRATASGYADGSVSVLVTVQVLSMPTTLNVPYGGTASVPLQISTPAPAGGVVVTLVSDNPAAVGVVTPTVTIPQGQQTTNAILSGVAPGTATVTGSTTDFGIDQTAAATRANLNILQSSVTFAQTFQDTLTVRLESSGTPVAAPGAGVSVDLTPRNPDCVAAPSPITIPTGLVSKVFVISYGGVATTPCNTYLVASATGIDSDSVYVAVNPPPGISGPIYTLGAGLQLNGNGYGYLGVANHGGVNVVVKSADSSLMLVSPNTTTVGADSTVLFVPNGQQYFYFELQAIEGVADTGVAQVQVTYSAPGFTTTSQTVTIRKPAFDVYSVPTGTTSLSTDSPFYVYLGYETPGVPYLTEFEPVRAGAQPLTVTVINDTLGVGNLTTTALTADTVTVQIAAGSYYSPTSVATGGVAYNPDNPGITTIHATIPGYTALTYYNRQITVTAPGITATAYTVAAGLQLNSNVLGYLGATNHGGVDVVVKSTNPGLLLVAPDPTTAGKDSVVVSVPDGQQYFYYELQAIEGVADTGVAQVQVTYSAPGFTTATQTHTIRPPVLDVYNVPANTTTLSSDAPFYVELGYQLPGYGYLWEAQSVRAGAQPLTVTVVNDTSAVGQLVTTALTGDTVTVQVPVGSYYSPTSVANGGVAYSPDNPGITTLQATIPGYTALTYYNRKVTVSAPTITAPLYTLGAGLQLNSNGYGYLGATNHGGVDVVVKSLNTSLLLVAPDQSTVGGDSLVLHVADGQQYFYYNLQALDGVADTGVAQALVSITAPGFTPLVQTDTVRRPSFDIYNIPTTTTTLSDSSPFYVQLGYTRPGYAYLYENQPIRAGGSPRTVTLAHSTPGVGRLITTAKIGDTVTVQIPVGSYYSPTTVATGGVAFDPLTAGSTTIAGSITGFDALAYANKTVTVSAPGITMYEWTVGGGLQKSVYGYLGAVNHGGTQVVVKSSAPSVALVSPDASTPGTDSIVFVVPDRQQYFYYYVQGVPGQTGTVTVTARGTGFTDGSAPLNVVQPAVGVYNLPSSVSLSSGTDSVAFYAEVGIPTSGNQYMSEVQQVSAGTGAFVVTLTSSTPAVGELVTSTSRGATVTVQIQPGVYLSPTTVVSGGVAFKKLTQGSTVVTSSMTGLITLSAEGNRTVTVNP
jgi:Bacterial Ig-like domain (group 1)